MTRHIEESSGPRYDYAEQRWVDGHDHCHNFSWSPDKLYCGIPLDKCIAFESAMADNLEAIAKKMGAAYGKENPGFDTPLSGEWADGPWIGDIYSECIASSLDPEYADLCMARNEGFEFQTMICDAWEAGYFRASAEVMA